MRYAAISAFLFLVGLTALSPLHPLLAQQEDRTELALSVLSGGPYYNRVTVGEDNLFFLHLRNVGNQPITDINLSALHPRGWEISFSAQTVASLAPGSARTVDVTVLAPTRTTGEDERITFVAEADDIREVLVFWVDVRAAQGYWWWVGGILALVVVVGFVAVYLRFGRS